MTEHVYTAIDVFGGILFGAGLMWWRQKSRRAIHCPCCEVGNE